MTVHSGCLQQIAVGLTVLLFGALTAAAQRGGIQASGVEAWITNADRSALLEQQPGVTKWEQAAISSQVIDIDETKKFQTMDGFGFALTGGSAQLLMKMSAEKRAQLLQELFAMGENSIGVSYLRLTIGSSDMNDRVFSYDDLYRGETDITMAKFSLAPDQADVIPVMKEILAVNPSIKILASPWSAPLWMKSSHRAQGGVLMPEYFEAYATYFVKYIQGMKAEDINIDAITVQNEPLNEKNTPSMLMLGEEQDEFIKTNLGPAFKKAGIKTKIVLYDHNLDHPLYVRDILRDKEAAQYVDGSGWHLYGGTVDAMTKIHDEFPDKNIYFTEQSVTDERVMRPAAASTTPERRGPKTPGAVQATAPGTPAGAGWSGGERSGAPWLAGGINLSAPVARVMIGVSRNWSRNVLLWNLAADPEAEPHTSDGGCGACWGALTLDGDKVNRLVAYYTLAQLSKFVPPGSVRIDSTTLETLPNVAFRTPEGKTVLVVANVTASPQTFDVRTNGMTAGSKTWPASLNSGSVGTYVW